MDWIVLNGKGERPKSKILKCAVAETVYVACQMRNKKIHGEMQKAYGIGKEVCRIIAVRCASKPEWTTPNLLADMCSGRLKLESSKCHDQKRNH